MESPLLPVILYNICSMRRHYQASDEHDGAQSEGHEKRRPQEPEDTSRVQKADPPAVASAASIAPTMRAAKKRRTSDITSSAQSFSYQKSKSFEERDEERSAFTSLPKAEDEEDTAAASSSAKEEEKKKPRQDPLEAGGPILPRPTVAPIVSSSLTTASSSHAQPHLSPMRYYHQQRYAENSGGSKTDAPAFQYQYRGGAAYPTQHNPYGYPAGYYNPPVQYPPQYPRPDPPSARGHPQFPYFQGYNYQQPQHQHHQHPSNMLPSAAAYSQQHRQFVHEYTTAPGSTPAVSRSKKDPPESIKVTEDRGVDLLVQSPREEDDERKPAARRWSSNQESSSGDQAKKHISPHTELHDLYAPLPFSEVHSLLTSASMKTPSPPSPSTQFAASAALAHLDPFASSPERTHAMAQLPQHSPVTSSKKRTRGRHPEHFPIGQSHSTTSTPSVSSSASKHGNSWDRRFNELVSLHFTMLNVYLPSSLCALICSIFSSSLGSCMAIVMYRRITHQTPALAFG